jgi:uncharacterized protein DUF2784
VIYRWLADLTVATHFAFLIFVLLGGVVARRSRWLLLAHLLAVAWAIYVEATPGLVCPLTPLENYFATRAGRAGYEGSFIEHYLVPILYPDGLTPTLQLTLAGVVVLTNLVVYAWSPLRRHFTNKAASFARMGLGAEDDDPRP